MMQMKHGTHTMTSYRRSVWQSILGTFQKASSRLPSPSLIGPDYQNEPRTKSHHSAGTSSILSSRNQLKLLSEGTLIMTIRYTCRQCSHVHFLDIPLYSSMKTKTFPLRCTQCSINSPRTGLLQWETDGNRFTISGV